MSWGQKQCSSIRHSSLYDQQIRFAYKPNILVRRRALDLAAGLSFGSLDDGSVGAAILRAGSGDVVFHLALVGYRRISPSCGSAPSGGLEPA